MKRILILMFITISIFFVSKIYAADPPFVGCNAGVGGNEWLCICQLPSGEWFVECSTIEAGGQKQPYIDKCGGDKDKAFLQWKWDVVINEANNACSCGGQNVCGSLIPTHPVIPIEVTEQPVPIEPTVLPTSIPVNPVYPTRKPIQEPFNAYPIRPDISNAQPNNSFNLILPSIRLNLPHFQINLSRLNHYAQQPLSIFENIFLLVKHYDTKLENYINQSIFNVINFHK